MALMVLLILDSVTDPGYVQYVVNLIVVSELIFVSLVYSAVIAQSTGSRKHYIHRITIKTKPISTRTPMDRSDTCRTFDSQ